MLRGEIANAYLDTIPVSRRRRCNDYDEQRAARRARMLLAMEKPFTKVAELAGHLEIARAGVWELRRKHLPNPRSISSQAHAQNVSESLASA